MPNLGKMCSILLNAFKSQCKLQFTILFYIFNVKYCRAKQDILCEKCRARIWESVVDSILRCGHSTQKIEAKCTCGDGI